MLRVATTARKALPLGFSLRAAHGTASNAYPKGLPAEDQEYDNTIIPVHNAVGIAGYEVDARLKGNDDPFAMYMKSSWFGTLDHPHLVPSYDTERIVGCKGGDDHSGYSHTLRFINVTDRTPTECPDCGQVFKIHPLGVAPWLAYKPYTGEHHH